MSTMSPDRVRYMIAPTPSPLIGTLLDTVSVSDGIEWLDDGLDQFETYNCMSFTADADFCQANEKDFDQTQSWVDAFRMVAYGGVICKSVGLDLDDRRAQVELVFNARESLAVERALMAHGFMASRDAAGDPLVPEDTITDLTPGGGAVKPAQGLAMLEGYMAANYAGSPVLHAPVSIASLFLGVAAGAVVAGDQIHTKLGSKLVAGAGYDYSNLGPDGTTASAGEKWLYATGEVAVRKGPLDIRQMLDQSTNDVPLLAERAYFVAVDCDSITAAIRVQETA